MAQVVEHLSRKPEALSSNSSIKKKKRRRRSSEWQSNACEVETRLACLGTVRGQGDWNPVIKGQSERGQEVTG
jgi:hypothetical protein